MIVHEGRALLLENQAESNLFMGLVKLKLLLQGYYISRKVTMQNILCPLFFGQRFLFFSGKEKVCGRGLLVISKL
jgi:hypothetical protein